MVNSYLAAQKTRYRITLDLNVLQDFNPHQIDWEKVLDLQPAESISTYVENLSAPDSW
jgi:predicted component of type VI protein secretion system